MFGQLLSLTERLLALAEQGEWEAFEVLLQQRELQRQALTVPAELTEIDRQHLAHLQQVNAKVLRLAESHRYRVQLDLQLIQRGDKVKHAYTKGRLRDQ